ncbi:MAG: hypothetical protein AB1831_12560 [Pseudomonadota bacterium]
MEQVRQAVLAYLRCHPGAADTAEGIACWWLPESLDVDAETVIRALDALVAEGRLRCHANADRHMVYARPARPPAD